MYHDLHTQSEGLKTNGLCVIAHISIILVKSCIFMKKSSESMLLRSSTRAYKNFKFSGHFVDIIGYARNNNQPLKDILRDLLKLDLIPKYCDINERIRFLMM